MAKFTIELEDEIFIRTVIVDGKSTRVAVKPSEIESVLGAVCSKGMLVLLTNVYNGGGKDATDAERLAALLKKIDSWKRGTFNVVERGETVFGPWKQVYLADCVAAGLKVADAEANIKAKVEARMPKGTKATFNAYLDAMALEYVEAGAATDAAEARELLEAYYSTEADKREKAAEKAKAKIVAPVIDLAAFRKA